jgi:hypothetical protein
MVNRIIDEQAFLSSSPPQARYARARLMVERGKGFVAAALLLNQKNQHSEVVLHLLCQGLEVFIKRLLLIKDYDTHDPKLENITTILYGSLISHCRSSKYGRCEKMFPRS